jgi:hypothetical protein
MDNPLKDNSPDTSKKKKHREQMIVLGTLILVVLTFMMVRNRGTSAPAGQPTTGAGSDPTADGVGGVAGGGGGSDMYSYLPAALAGIPGQVQALMQGDMSRILRLERQNRKLGRKSVQLEHKIIRLEHHDHPKRPKHPIPVHRTHVPTRHPPTHHRPVFDPHPPIRRV